MEADDKWNEMEEVDDDDEMEPLVSLTTQLKRDIIESIAYNCYLLYLLSHS